MKKFRKEAVEHYYSSGRSQSGGSVEGSEVNLEEGRREILRLREENRILKMERDILKKATRFFANESQERSSR
jgi:transposase-like protein